MLVLYLLIIIDKTLIKNYYFIDYYIDYFDEKFHVHGAELWKNKHQNFD